MPVIETLHAAGKLTDAQFLALDHYREQAHKAEDDVAQVGTLAAERVMGGGHAAPSSRVPAVLIATPAIIETARIERDLGSLLSIARAIAVEDWSLTRWCIEQNGGEEGHDKHGRFIGMVPKNAAQVLHRAEMELKFAASRITR